MLSVHLQPIVFLLFIKGLRFRTTKTKTLNVFIFKLQKQRNLTLAKRTAYFENFPVDKPSPLLESILVTTYSRHNWLFHTCQPPGYKNLEMSRNLCILRVSFKTMSRNNRRKSPGGLMKNLETPGKTRRVGRYVIYWQNPKVISWTECVLYNSVMQTS